MSEEFWLTLVPLIFSGMGNLVLLWRGSERKKEQSAAEYALSEVTKRLLAQDAVRVEEVEKVAKYCGDNPHAARVMDRTMNIEISKSQRLMAFGQGE